MMRFGVVGVGGIGALRISALDSCENAVFSAAYDVSEAFLAKLPASVQTFTSAQDMMKSDACDAVIISTPTQFHEELALLALENGKHVLVEKPMASSLEACLRMQDTAQQAGKILTVGFNQRYFPAIKDVRDAIQSGALGELKYVKGFAGHTGLSEFSSPWMYDKDIMGGGTLMDNGIHTMDLVCHLMGGVDQVSGMIRTDTWDLDRSEDNAFVHLTNSAGVMGTLHSSWTEWKGYRFFVEAYGDKGMARAYYAPMFSQVITMDKPGGERSIKRKFYIEAIFREKFFGWQSTVIRAFAEELADFVGLATGGAAGHIAHCADGVRSCAVPNAVYRSHDEKRIVSLDEMTA